MKGRTVVLPLLLALIAGCTSPSEPSNDLQVSLTGYVETTNGAAGFSFEVTLDGVRWPSLDTSTSYARIDNLMYYGYNPSFGRGHHTFELRCVSQTASPTPYAFSRWSIKRLGPQLGPTLVLSETALPDQTAAVATGQSIRWDFDI